MRKWGKAMKPEQSDGLTKIDLELKEVTDIASNRVRTIAGGIVAFSWYAIAGSPEKAPAFVSANSLYIPLILSLLSLFADFLQYGFSWIELHSRRSSIARHQPGIWLASFYRISFAAFVVKVCLVMVSAIWLIVVLSTALYRLR